MSSNATLCFGFVLTDEEGESENHVPTWLNGQKGSLFIEQAIERIFAITKPVGLSDLERRKKDKQFNKLCSDYEKALVDLQNGLNIDLIQFGDENHRHHILAIKSSITVARNDKAIAVKTFILPYPEWKTQLQEFCTKIGQKYENPEFLLTTFED